MENEKSVTPFFRSMQDLSKGVYQLNEGEHKEDPRSRSVEEITSYQKQRTPENPRSPHISTMPTFFEEAERYGSEEMNEAETHETLNIYLREYKAQSRDFKEKLTLQQFFQIRE